jgi:catalase
MSTWEKEHIIEAYRFELGKVSHLPIRALMVEHLNQIDHDLAVAVAVGIGVEAPSKAVDNHGRSSPALSQANTAHDSIAGRKIAVLVGDWVDEGSVLLVQSAAASRGAVCELLGPVDGMVATGAGGQLAVTKAMTTTASVLYDAVVVPDGVASLAADGFAVHFVAEAYKHGKAIGAVGSGSAVLNRAELPLGGVDEGVVVREAVDERFVSALLGAVAAHRNFNRLVEAVVA